MYRYFKRVAGVGIFGNLKDCLTKPLHLLLHLIIALIQNYTVLVLKQEKNSEETI